MGEAGEAGKAGEAGQAGQAGQAGEAGEAGEAEEAFNFTSSFCSKTCFPSARWLEVSPSSGVTRA